VPPEPTKIAVLLPLNDTKELRDFSLLCALIL
jgi:hypothetical protein